MNDIPRSTEVVELMSPDEIMRRNPYMAKCASTLIEACKKSHEGRMALIVWDKARGRAPGQT